MGLIISGMTYGGTRAINEGVLDEKNRGPSASLGMQLGFRALLGLYRDVFAENRL